MGFLWLSLLVLFLGPNTLDAAYREEQSRWRSERETSLKADGGWLTVTGLFWLQAGENPVGTGRSNAVRLPAGSPERLGRFLLEGDRVRFTPSVPGTQLNGIPVPDEGAEIRPYQKDGDDMITFGSLQFLLLERGDRRGIRLRDNQSQARREFSGLKWYPIDEKWRIVGRFTPSPDASQIVYETVIGDQQVLESAGFVTFSLGGQELTLEAGLSDNRLFFVFRDETARSETYPAGRFLYADYPAGETVELDFNRAYNPPCAFTPYATCPLPPPQNRLPVEIRAGELKYGK